MANSRHGRHRIAGKHIRATVVGVRRAKRLRRIDPGVCAIVSSGYSRDPVLANYRSYGFQAILPKPYGLEQLTKVMGSVLDGATNPT